jgi:hypothetical protein
MGRGWGTLRAKDWGKGILPGTVNKQARQAREALEGAGAPTKSRKACESGRGRITPQERGEDPLHAGTNTQA